MEEVIENELLKVAVSLSGGSLTSVTDKRTNEELLWQPNNEIWNGQDVVIFPFIGRLKNMCYTVDGHNYSMESHGLVRYSMLDIMEKRKDSIKLCLKSNAETLKRYPFNFVFCITYTLDGNTLSIKMNVDNCGSKDMFFGLGAHPAYYIDGIEKGEETDTDGNTICFEQAEELALYTTDVKGQFITGFKNSGNTQEINLSKKLFQQNKVVIISNPKSKQITIKKKSGREIKMQLNNPPVLALWSNPTRGNYVCVEPWFGLPDFENSTSEISEKQLIQKLKPNENFVYSYRTIY